jgi:hypothetical protein
MRFLFPEFLFALLVLSIPIIIHLFNFRRFKTIYYSNVALLKLLKIESKRKTQLKQLFILLARILTFTSLVFAFSRPYLPSINPKLQFGNQHVAIFIDNSFSMKNMDENGQILEQTKMKAIEIADSYPIGTKFLFSIADFLPQHRFILTKDQLIQQISETKESPLSPEFNEVYQQMRAIFEENQCKTNKVLYFLSDFQKGKSNFNAVDTDSSIQTYLVPFRSEKINNLSIDSCWFEIPGHKIGGEEKLYVKIINYSQQSYEKIPIRLSINDSLKAIQTISIGGKQEAILELNYTNNSDGLQLCKLEIDDYPIIYDNTYYFNYLVKNKLKVLGIFNPEKNGSKYLKALFTDDLLIEYDETPETNVTLSSLKNYQSIFLLNNNKISSGLSLELKNFISTGGSLVIFPNLAKNTEEYNSLLNTLGCNTIESFDTASISIATVNYSHAIYEGVFSKPDKDVDLPRINGFANIKKEYNNSGISLLKFRNGNDALQVYRLENGTVYLFAFTADDSNLDFIRHILFVPTIYNIVAKSDGVQKYAYQIGRNESVMIKQSAYSSDLSLLNYQTKNEVLISVRRVNKGFDQVIFSEPLTTSGHYLINNEQINLMGLSYNYSRKESSAEFFSNDEINNQIKENQHIQLIESSSQEFSEIMQDINTGRQLWKLFIILALMFVFIEIGIIRFWK